MTVRAGMMSCAFQILAPPKHDGFTQRDPRPQRLGPLFGRPLSKSGAERFVDPSYIATVTHMFTTGYSRLVNPGVWLEWSRSGGRIARLNVQFAFDPEERERFLVVGCVEIPEESWQDVS